MDGRGPVNGSADMDVFCTWRPILFRFYYAHRKCDPMLQRLVRGEETVREFSVLVGRWVGCAYFGRVAFASWVFGVLISSLFFRVIF